MAKKKNNQGLFIGIGIIAVALFFIGPQIGLFATYDSTMENSDRVYDIVQIDDGVDIGNKNISLNEERFVRVLVKSHDTSIEDFMLEVTSESYYSSTLFLSIETENESILSFNLFLPDTDLKGIELEEGEYSLTLSKQTSEWIVSDWEEFYVNFNEGKCLFSIGTFCIKLWMILTLIGGIFLIIILKK